MKISSLAFNKIKEFEGLRTEAYLDAAGVPTIGYGHTRDVHIGDRISPYWAEHLLKEDIERVEREVERLKVARTQGQLDALVSFAFNVGPEQLRKSKLLSEIRKRTSAAAIRREFMRWVYAGGKRLRGLERRRQWEVTRFFESEY